MTTIVSDEDFNVTVSNPKEGSIMFYRGGTWTHGGASATAGQFLQYHGANGWEPVDSLTHISELEGVNLHGQHKASILWYDDTDGEGTWKNTTSTIPNVPNIIVYKDGIWQPQQYALTEIEDVTTTGILRNGAILQYDSTLSKWKNTQGIPQPGQVLTWNANNGWIASNLPAQSVSVRTFQDASPAVTHGRILYSRPSGNWALSPTPSDKDVLMWDKESDRWLTAKIPNQASDLLDFNLTGMSPGSIIAYNGSGWGVVGIPETMEEGYILIWKNGWWSAESPGETSIMMDDLTDAKDAPAGSIIYSNGPGLSWHKTDAPYQEGQIYRWGGSAWELYMLGNTLDSLEGVNVSTAISGSILFYDGTTWVPATAPLQPNNVLIWNGTTWAPGAQLSGVDTMAELTDVINPTKGAIVYASAQDVWSKTTYSALSDTDNGKVLTWSDANGWQPMTPDTGTTDLDGLLGATGTLGKMVYHNGTDWTITGSPGTNPEDNAKVLKWNLTGWFAEKISVDELNVTGTAGVGSILYTNNGTDWNISGAMTANQFFRRNGANTSLEAVEIVAGTNIDIVNATGTLTINNTTSASTFDGITGLVGSSGKMIYHDGTNWKYTSEPGLGPENDGEVLRWNQTDWIATKLKVSDLDIPSTANIGSLIVTNNATDWVYSPPMTSNQLYRRNAANDNIEPVTITGTSPIDVTHASGLITISTSGGTTTTFDELITGVGTLGKIVYHNGTNWVTTGEPGSQASDSGKVLRWNQTAWVNTKLSPSDLNAVGTLSKGSLIYSGDGTTWKISSEATDDQLYRFNSTTGTLGPVNLVGGSDISVVHGASDITFNFVGNSGSNVTLDGLISGVGSLGKMIYHDGGSGWKTSNEPGANAVDDGKVLRWNQTNWVPEKLSPVDLDTTGAVGAGSVVYSSDSSGTNWKLSPAMVNNQLYRFSLALNSMTPVDILAGSNVTIVHNASDITISSTAGGGGVMDDYLDTNGVVGSVAYHNASDWTSTPTPGTSGASDEGKVLRWDGTNSWTPRRLEFRDVGSRGASTGTIVYYNGTAWNAANPNTAGQLLRWNGSNTWEAAKLAPADLDDTGASLGSIIYRNSSNAMVYSPTMAGNQVYRMNSAGTALEPTTLTAGSNMAINHSSNNIEFNSTVGVMNDLLSTNGVVGSVAYHNAFDWTSTPTPGTSGASDAGKVLRWNGTNSWTPSRLDFRDVGSSGASTGTIPYYNGTAWIAANPSVAGQLLRWNGSNAWEAAKLAPADLDDTGASLGSIIYRNSSNAMVYSPTMAANQMYRMNSAGTALEPVDVLAGDNISIVHSAGAMTISSVRSILYSAVSIDNNLVSIMINKFNVVVNDVTITILSSNSWNTNDEAEFFIDGSFTLTFIQGAGTEIISKGGLKSISGSGSAAVIKCIDSTNNKFALIGDLA